MDADESLDPIDTPSPQSVRGTFGLGGICQSHVVVIRRTCRFSETDIFKTKKNLLKNLLSN